MGLVPYEVEMDGELWGFGRWGVHHAVLSILCWRSSPFLEPLFKCAFHLHIPVSESHLP